MNDYLITKNKKKLTAFSWWSISAVGLVMKKSESPMKATTPSRWVQMLPVSVWIRNID